MTAKYLCGMIFSSQPLKNCPQLFFNLNIVYQKMNSQTVLNQFISSLEEQGKSSSTQIAYKKDISQLIEYLNAKQNPLDFAKVNSKTLQTYIEDLKKQGDFTLKTISRKINSLKTFFKFLFTQKLIVENFAQDVHHPKIEANLPRVLSSMEYRALRDVARNNLRLYSMVELMLQTGITIGELSRLKKNDLKIGAAKSTLFISAFSSKPAREIELNPVCVQAMDYYLLKMPGSKSDQGYLFSTKAGNPVLIRNIRTAINKAFEKAGIRGATVNDIRNTFIVYQLENGLDIKKLAALVGHQKSTTTERYLDLLTTPYKKKLDQVKPL